MKDPTGDSGTIQVLLDRLNTWRLPRALAIKDRVDRGEKLDDHDMQFLKGVAEDSAQAQTLVSKHPELQPLMNKLVGLYSHIMQKALENEQKD